MLQALPITYTYLLSTLECSSFSLVEADLHLLQLLFESLTEAIRVHAVFLLLAELVSKSGSVGHCLLAALLGCLVLIEGLVKIGLETCIRQ